MIPIRQTKFVATHGAGNCQQAAMASLLELPLDDVIDTACPEMRARGFWESIRLWLADRGLKIVHVWPDDEAFEERLKGQYSIASGPSPRGPFHHAIVCKNGKMVWDVHPSDDGVLAIEKHELIVPMTAVEIQIHEFRKLADAEAKKVAE